MKIHLGEKSQSKAQLIMYEKNYRSISLKNNNVRKSIENNGENNNLMAGVAKLVINTEINGAIGGIISRM